MAKKYYWPTRRGDRSLWLANYKSQIVVQGPIIGLSPAEVTAQQTASDSITNQMEQTDQARAAYEAEVEREKQFVHDDFATISDSVARQKTHSAFTTEIGERLGTIGDERTIDVNTEKPVLKASQTTEGWRIEFNLKDYFSAVRIQRKRPADADFIFLADDTSSPYIDTDPQQNGTEYRGVFLLNDQQAGQWSDTVRVRL